MDNQLATAVEMQHMVLPVAGDKKFWYNTGKKLQPITIVQRIGQSTEYRIRPISGKEFAASLEDLRVPSLHVW